MSDRPTPDRSEWYDDARLQELPDRLLLFTKVLLREMPRYEAPYGPREAGILIVDTYERGTLLPAKFWAVVYRHNLWVDEVGVVKRDDHLHQMGYEPGHLFALVSLEQPTMPGERGHFLLTNDDRSKSA